jgi:hypothetical protein
MLLRECADAHGRPSRSRKGLHTSTGPFRKFGRVLIWTIFIVPATPDLTAVPSRPPAGYSPSHLAHVAPPPVHLTPTADHCSSPSGRVTLGRDQQAMSPAPVAFESEQRAFSWDSLTLVRTTGRRRRFSSHRCRVRSRRSRVRSRRSRVNWRRCRINELRCRINALRCRINELRCRINELRCRINELRCRINDILLIK